MFQNIRTDIICFQILQFSDISRLVLVLQCIFIIFLSFVFSTVFFCLDLWNKLDGRYISKLLAFKDVLILFDLIGFTCQKVIFEY